MIRIGKEENPYIKHTRPLPTQESTIEGGSSRFYGCQIGAADKLALQMTELFAAEHEGQKKSNADPLAAIDETFSD